MTEDLFPAGKIENIRDFLIVALAPDLQKWGDDNGITLNAQEAREIVAFILDHLTGKSYGLLAKLGQQMSED
jgi:hypothetical protein